MKNKSLRTIPPAKRSVRFPRAVAVAVMSAAIVSFVGCSSKASDSSQTPVVAARNVTLTAAQRQNIHLYTVTPSKFRKTIETTGVVDFDNDQATSVLAPFYGPVSRLLVSTGDHVKKGDPLAVVVSPDFATAISTYRKALATARTDRHLADIDKDLIEHSGVAQREAAQAETDAANAGADRDAALQALVSLSIDPMAIKDIQEGRPISRIEGIIRSPIAGTVVEKAHHARRTSRKPAPRRALRLPDRSARLGHGCRSLAPTLLRVNLGDSAEVITGIDSNNFSRALWPTSRPWWIPTLVLRACECSSKIRRLSDRSRCMSAC